MNSALFFLLSGGFVTGLLALLLLRRWNDVPVTGVAHSISLSSEHPTAPASEPRYAARVRIDHLSMMAWIHTQGLERDPITFYFEPDGNHLYLLLDRTLPGVNRRRVEFLLRYVFPLVPGSVQWQWLYKLLAV